MSKELWEQSDFFFLVISADEHTFERIAVIKSSFASLGVLLFRMF